MVDILKKELNMDFDEAVKHVEKIVIDEGFSHMLTKPIHSIFKQKLGIDYPKYTIILACAPELAKGALHYPYTYLSQPPRIFPCAQ